MHGDDPAPTGAKDPLSAAGPIGSLRNKRLYQVVARRIAQMIEANATASTGAFRRSATWPRRCRSHVPRSARR